MSGRFTTNHPDEPLDCSLPQYTCSRAEKQLLRTCMNAATSAGMALGLQGATTGLLGDALPPGNYYIWACCSAESSLWVAWPLRGEICSLKASTPTICSAFVLLLTAVQDQGLC